VTTEEVLSRLDGTKRNGDGWVAKCPAHDDHNPSLSAKEGDDGRTLLNCHAGCEPQEVVAAMGLTLSDLYTDEIGGRQVAAPRPASKSPPPITEETVAAMHVALTPKQRELLRDHRCLSDGVIDHYRLGFVERHGRRVAIPVMDSAGKIVDVRLWLPESYREDGVAKILHWAQGYGAARLFPVNQFDRKHLVLVAGELDALALISAGIPAITVTAGESTWPDRLSKQIADAGVEEVVIIPDNDDTGQKGAQKRAQSLSHAGLTVRMAAWPEGRDNGWDVTDELREHGVDALQEHLDQAVLKRSDVPSSLYTVGTSERLFTLRSAEGLIRETPDVVWQVDGMLAEGASMLLAGEAGLGKTWLTLDLALAVDLGRSWLGHFEVKSGKVLIVDEENADRLIRKRLQKLLLSEGEPDNGSTLGIQFMTQQGLNLSDPEHVVALRGVLDECKPSLVIVDSLVRVHQANENDAGEVAKVFRVVRGLINEYGCSFVFCHHRRKPGPMGNDAANGFRGSSEIRAFVDTHLDLRKSKSAEGRCLVEHSKSRYDEPVPSFEVEITDPDETSTTVRYIGEAKSDTQAIVEEGCNFIRELIADGEYHCRGNIIESGKGAGLKRDTLDTARKLLIESGEATPENHGREVGIRRSDVPNTLRVPERNVEDILI
jgi:5S rRNA maturation endonuclease (ribonuclease M5)